MADGRSGRPDREHKSEYPANDAEQSRFDQELRKYLAAGRPDRLAKADLERPLRNRDQHDVHHNYAADDEDDQRDRYNDGGDRTRYLIHLRIELIYIDDAECIFFCSDQLAFVTKDQSGFFDRVLEIFGISLSVYLMPPVD